MAKYNIYGHVLYSEIQYEKLMQATERIFINALMNRLPSIKEWTDDIWNTIDHEYMITTLEEIKRDVIQSDIELMLRYEDMQINIEKLLESTDKLEDLFTLNKIEKFRTVEKSYGNHIARAYKRKLKTIEEDYIDDFTYLTEQIKEFSKLEQTISYFNAEGEIVRRVTPSTYLSMLYNVNLTRTGWNQTFKDADYLEKDLVILETHPRSCPHCAPMQGKIYSRTGKSKKYPSIDVAYENGVGHPNCKCEWSIYWNSIQMETQYLAETKTGEYQEYQKKKAIEREIRKQENDLSLYRMIGNEEMSDKTRQKIETLASKLSG